MAVAQISAAAKDKPRVTVHVLEAETSERESTYTVAGSPAVTKTSCANSETQSVYAKENGRTLRAKTDTNGTSNCTTVAQPAVAPSTRTLAIRQENVQAVMEDGRNVTLWCQQGWRQCVPLKPGFYSGELDGDAVWIYIKDLSGKEHKVKYKAVAVSDPAPAREDNG